MFYSENKNSVIDQTLKSLEECHRARQEKCRERIQHPSSLLKKLLSAQMLNVFNQSDPRVQGIIKESQKKLKTVSFKIQHEIEKDPWAFLGKVALVAFGVGMVLSHHGPFKRRRKR